MIDEKGRLFGKISILDLVIVLAIAVAIAGFAYKMTAGSRVLAIKGDTAVTLTVELKGVRGFTVDAAQVGDKVYETHGSYLGTITGVDTKPNQTPMDLDDGRQVLATNEGRFNLVLTLESEARVTDEATYIGGTRLVAPGGEIKVQTNRLQGTAVVASVAPIA